MVIMFIFVLFILVHLFEHGHIALQIAEADEQADNIDEHHAEGDSISSDHVAGGVGRGF